ncbi:MAG: hypothetical protein ACRD6N_20760 [Pyrinomonadaceae bacterium]
MAIGNLVLLIAPAYAQSVSAKGHSRQFAIANRQSSIVNLLDIPILIAFNR